MSISFSTLISQIDKTYLQNISSLINTRELNDLIFRIREGKSGDWILNPKCQLIAFEACRLKKISIPEFCSLSAIRALIEDHVELKLNYARMDTLAAFTIPPTSFEKTQEIEFLKKSLRVDDNILVSNTVFEEFLIKASKLSYFEKLVYYVQLNSNKYWPTMLNILSQYGKLFRPFHIADKHILLLPSFSLKSLLVSTVFNKDYACQPVPILGNAPLKLLLKYEKKGKRVIGYNFPDIDNLIDADLIFTGKLLFTEHDWSHVEENSILSKDNQALLALLNELYYKQYCHFKNNKIAEYRIFSLGDMQFQCYNLVLNAGILTDSRFLLKKSNINHLILLLIFIEVLFFPMGCQFCTYEMLSLEKALFGNNLSEEGFVRTVPENELNNFQINWNQDIDIFIKKLIAFVLINRDVLFNKFNFDIEIFDWELQQEESKYYLSLCLDEILCFKKMTYEGIQKKLKRIKEYYYLCKGQLKKMGNSKTHSKNDLLKIGYKSYLNIVKEDLRTIEKEWQDPKPDFTFNMHYINSIDFHVGKGLKIKLSKKDCVF